MNQCLFVNSKQEKKKLKINKSNSFEKKTLFANSPNFQSKIWNPVHNLFCFFLSQMMLRTVLRNNFYALPKLENRFISSFVYKAFSHEDNVLKLQNETFKRVWENDIGDFKRLLTKDEIEAFQKKVDLTASFDQVHKKFQDLFGPHRHACIRETRTWKFLQASVNSWLDSHHPSDLVFGSESDFLIFYNANLKDNHLFSDFKICDLRYAVTCAVIDYVGGPKITLLFGCRNSYRIKYPSHKDNTAKWQVSVFDKLDKGEVVLMAAMQCIAEKKLINVDFF